MELLTWAEITNICSMTRQLTLESSESEQASPKDSRLAQTRLFYSYTRSQGTECKWTDVKYYWSTLSIRRQDFTVCGASKPRSGKTPRTTKIHMWSAWWLAAGRCTAPRSTVVTSVAPCSKLKYNSTCKCTQGFRQRSPETQPRQMQSRNWTQISANSSVRSTQSTNWSSKKQVSYHK